MPMGFKAGGRQAGTPNKATAEVRALAGRHGPAALDELARLAGLVTDDDGKTPVGSTQSETARISALGMILDRAYGKSRLTAPIEIELPDTSTPQGVIEAVSAILQAATTDKILPADANDLCAIIEAQRKAIELGDHEGRLKLLEAARS